MNLTAYAWSGPPPEMVWIACPYCRQRTYSPESQWIRKEIETLGCGWCEQSIKGDERFDAIGHVNEEEP